MILLVNVLRQIKDFGDELAIKIEDFEMRIKTLPEENIDFLLTTN